MAPDAASEGYGRTVLADGLRPFLHRSGVRALLGVPEDTGVAVSFTPVVRGRSFPYVREHAGDPAAPSGWDDLLARPTTAPEMPARWPEPTGALPDIAHSIRTGPGEGVRKPVERSEGAPEGAAAPSSHAERQPGGREDLPPEAAAVAELVLPGRTLKAGEARSGPRPRTPAPATMSTRATRATVSTRSTRPSAPGAVAHDTTAPSAPSPPTRRSGAEAVVEPQDLGPDTPADEPQGPPARGPRYDPTHRPGSAARAPSRAPRDRRPAEGLVGTPAQLPPDEDPFTQSTATARRPRTSPPYRTAVPVPSAAAPRQATEPTPVAPAAPPPPALAAPAPQPPVVVVRAPAAPTGAAAFWERRHHGRLRDGVVR